MVEHTFKWKNNGRTKVMIGCGTCSEIIKSAAAIKRRHEYFDVTWCFETQIVAFPQYLQNA